MGDPEGKTKPAAILCTDPNKSPLEIVKHHVKRWQAEVTLQEVRIHLGVETQRQWSDLAILRTTPILMATFSIITLWANKMKNIEINQTTWYQKKMPTFSDTINAIRNRIWQYWFSLLSSKNKESKEIKRLLIKHLIFMTTRAS